MHTALLISQGRKAMNIFLAAGSFCAISMGLWHGEAQSLWTHQDEGGEFWSCERTGGQSAMQGCTRVMNFFFSGCSQQVMFSMIDSYVRLPKSVPLQMQGMRTLAALLSVSTLHASALKRRRWHSDSSAIFTKIQFLAYLKMMVFFKCPVWVCVGDSLFSDSSSSVLKYLTVITVPLAWFSGFCL